MTKIVLALLCLVTLTCSLYTSSYWKKKGFDVSDGIFTQEKNYNDVHLQTVCNELNLSSPPFNHSGVVYSGYLSVNKAGSGLAFMFYGREGAPKE